MRPVLPALAAAATAAALGAASAQGAAQDAERDARSVTVSGAGTASAVPDVATLRFSSVSRDETAASAMEANARRATAMREALRHAGVDARDMKSTGLSLNAYYESSSFRGGGEKVAGYEARNALMVRLRDVDAVGDVIDAAVRAGANGLDSLQFGFQDEAGLREAARVDAVRDAEAAAGLLADAAGARLGRVLMIEEHGGGIGPRADMMVMETRSAATPIEAGEQAVTASVRITYALE